jgi:hypothetical protein
MSKVTSVGFTVTTSGLNKVVKKRYRRTDEKGFVCSYFDNNTPLSNKI